MPKPCPICGSRKWRKDAVSGSAICEDGHVFQDFRSENLILEPSGHALQKRTIRKGPRRNRKKDEGAANRDFYHGDDAAYLRCQALQLLSRLQLQALKKLWSLPDAFELIVRDLWAYQLAFSTLPERPISLDNSAIGGSMHQVNQAPNDDDMDKDGDGESSEDSKSEASSKFDEEDLLARLSEDSMSTGSETPHTDVDEAQDAKWKRRKPLKVIDTLVTIIVGLWILRTPFMNVELESLVNQVKIPFIDFGHTNLLPTEMRKHMNASVIRAISPNRAPNPLRLHERCLSFVQKLHRRYNITIPEVNIPPLAWKILSSLGCSPTHYTQVMNLLRLLDVNLSLLQPDTRQHSRRYHFTEQQAVQETDVEIPTLYDDLWLPEVSVVASFMIVMKMTYGLDGEERHALIKDDPVIGLPTKESWIKELKERAQCGTLKGSRADLDRQDFTRLEVQDIDRFLDRSASLLLKDRDLPEESSFPLARPIKDSVEPPSYSWTAFHRTAPVISPSAATTNMPNKALPLLPGEGIRTYDSTDITGTLPREYEIVLQACSDVIGVPTEHIAKCVEVFERRLEKLRLENVERDPYGSKQRSRSGGRPGSRSSVQQKRSARSLRESESET